MNRTKITFLAPGQWKIVQGVKIENTTDKLLRITLTVEEAAK